ncbi:hypothetical protein L1987_22814 [Smallanthus sonchifolius]|uniref:Uncharacterized protein n=1 Tax=Smallanthus sonchifolius TaxID=185202 RepID=A0ACB9IHD1_9ASTR|nr:hypothetical protein L1987_22814 [Smallanthus sonchifolius]
MKGWMEDSDLLKSPLKPHPNPSKLAPMAYSDMLSMLVSTHLSVEIATISGLTSTWVQDGVRPSFAHPNGFRIEIEIRIQDLQGLKLIVMLLLKKEKLSSPLALLWMSGKGYARACSRRLGSTY